MRLARRQSGEHVIFNMTDVTHALGVRSKARRSHRTMPGRAVAIGTRREARWAISAPLLSLLRPLGRGGSTQSLEGGAGFPGV
jgi:hypothetical protein